MKKRSLSVVAVAVFVGGMAQAAIVFDVTTDHPNAMYKCGEKAALRTAARTPSRRFAQPFRVIDGRLFV